MSLKNTAENYGTLGLVLHWGMAVLMLAAFLVGNQLEDMPRGPEKLQIIGIHLLIGGPVLLFALIRLGWRRADPAPALPAAMARWEVWAAKGVHLALYVAMVGLPVSGMMAVTSVSQPLPVLDLFHMPVLIASKDLHEAAETVHVALVNVLIVAVALHVAGTGWHRVVRKDAVAGRMIPFLRAR